LFVKTFKNSKTLLLLASWLLLGNSLAGSAPSQEPGPNLARGGALYAAYCAACHGADGSGQRNLASPSEVDSTPLPPNLKSWVRKGGHSDKALREVILGGGTAVHKSGYMPAWDQTLTGQQVEDLVAYIRQLEQGEAPPSLLDIEPLEDELRIGQALYSIRCLACHGLEGKGDGFLLDSLVGPETGTAEVQLPDFSSYSSLRSKSDDDIQAVIASGISHSGLKLRTSNGWWNRKLNPAETRALILYLRSLPHPESDETN
jgi:mono/diheme cytochrome c family protein